jgi:hypothetical protein
MPVAVEVFSFHSILEVAQGRLLSNPGVAIIIAALPSTKKGRSEALAPRSASTDTLG